MIHSFDNQMVSIVQGIGENGATTKEESKQQQVGRERQKAEATAPRQSLVPTAVA